MTNILKIEAFSGASGDMFLGALAALADGYDDLVKLPELLNLDSVEVQINPKNKNGIACKHVHIIDLKNESEHVHRHLRHVLEIIHGSKLNENAQKIASDIFKILAEAEAKVHGSTIEKVHFHEVGAIDSIMDIVGTALLLDRLNITQTYATPICTGYGFVNTQHGKMPVPAPATQQLLTGMPTYAGDCKAELCTPTGAAILCYLSPDFDMPVLTEASIGYGPGIKDFEQPNVLRLSLCRMRAQTETELVVVETNIDDLSGEFLGTDFQNGLLNIGAVDFYLNQVMMKKGRPGIILSVICRKQDMETIATYILENTTSIGIRYYSVNRMILDRETSAIATEHGDIEIKSVTLPSGKKRSKIEYDSLAELAKISSETTLDINDKLRKTLSS